MAMSKPSLLIRELIKNKAVLEPDNIINPKLEPKAGGEGRREKYMTHESIGRIENKNVPPKILGLVK